MTTGAPPQSITASALTPYIGAEISGIDLCRPLGEDDVRALHAALIEYQVIFFRDQPMKLADQVALGRHFGGLHVHSGLASISADFPEVTRIHADETSVRANGEEWHTDLSCDPNPPMGSILHIHTLPASGGDTIWSSMYAAYDALSAPMKKYLETLTATHDGALTFGKLGGDRSYPVSVHPVVACHPNTGRKLIYVNRAFTTHINGVSKAESSAILNYLFDHVQRVEFQVRFRWRKHSVAFWDNRCTQHTAIWDYFPNTRSGYRVQIDTATL